MDSFEKKIEEAKLANLKEEKEIILTRKIDKDSVRAFNYWFDYGAASTIGFLIRRLKLIKSIIEDGNSVTIEEEPVIILKNQGDFKNWIKSRFDEILIEDVYAKN